MFKTFIKPKVLFILFFATTLFFIEGSLVVLASESFPTITSASSKAAPEGVLYSGEEATIYGTNLLGNLSVKIGVQEPKTVQANGLGNSISFTVPEYRQTLYTSITVTNSEEITSNSIPVKIEATNKQAPIINNIQSSGNPTGTVDAGKKAFIYGNGLSGLFTIKLGNQEPQYVQATGISDSYAEFTLPYYSQSVSLSVIVTNADGVTSNSYPLRVEVPLSSQPVNKQKPTIDKIVSKAAPEGVLYSGEEATIYGTDLSGQLNITLGVQEAKNIQANGSGKSVSFVVPQYNQTSYVSVAITDASGVKSEPYSVKIEVPKTDTAQKSEAANSTNKPLIVNVQSAANPEGVVDAGRRASIYGNGLSGSLEVKIGTENPQILKILGKSDTYAEFVVPAIKQPVSTILTVKNTSGLDSNTYRVTIQAEGWKPVESNSVEELLQKGGKYEALDIIEKVGSLTIAPGEIRTNTATVPTTEIQLIVDLGTRAVSVEPTVDNVLIRDKNLEVTVDKEVTITNNGIKIGEIPVSVSASEATEKFKLKPEEILLTTKGEDVVYDIQTIESRKLFGLIPVRLKIKVIVSAQNDTLVEEFRPWYSILTTD